MNEKTIEYWVYLIVIVIVFFSILASLIPQAQNAGDTLYAVGSGTPNALPLGSLFAGNGVVFYLLMGIILIVLITTVIRTKRN